MIELTKEELKQKLLSLIPSEQRQNMSSIILAILDEAIDAAYEGRIKMNDKIPTTEIELMYCTSKYLESATTIYSEMVNSLKKNLPDYNININYRGQTFEH